MGANCFSEGGAGSLVAEPIFDPIEVGYKPEEEG